MNYTTRIKQSKLLTHNISLYQNDTPTGNVTFNVKYNKAFIEVVYLTDKYRNKNIFRNYWNAIETHIIVAYTLIYPNTNILTIELEAKELNVKHNRLVNKYKLFGFDTFGKERIKYVDEVCYRIVPMKKEITLD